MLPTKYCLYVKRKGLIGWLTGWYIVKIFSSVDEYCFFNFEAVSSVDFYMAVLKMPGPFSCRFWMIPKRAEIIKNNWGDDV